MNALRNIAGRIRRAFAAGGVPVLFKLGFPVTGVVTLALSLMVVAGMVLALFGVSAGNLFSLSIDSLSRWELWRLATFPFSSFPVIETQDAGNGLPAVTLAAFLICCFSAGAVVLGGVAVERRLGSRRLGACLLAAVALQAAFTLVIFGSAAAFSPVAMAFTLLTMSQLIELEGGERGREAVGDLRLVVAVFLLVLVAVCAAFEPGFRPLLGSLFVGPVLGVIAFTLARRTEYRRVERLGSGSVGGYYYAEEVELISLDELKQRTDRLLDKIARDGMESLGDDQRGFLTRASERLRGSKTRAGNDGGQTGR